MRVMTKYTKVIYSVKIVNLLDKLSFKALLNLCLLSVKDDKLRLLDIRNDLLADKACLTHIQPNLGVN